MKNVIIIIAILFTNIYAKTNQVTLVKEIKLKIKKNGVDSLEPDECMKTYLTYWKGRCLISKKYKYEKLKNRNVKLTNAKTYLGIKMYTSINENKKIEPKFDRYKGTFKMLGLTGEVRANDFDEIEKIVLSGTVDRNKLNQFKSSLNKKYKLLDKKHNTKIETAENLNTKAYNMYALGFITGAYYQMYSQNLTDKTTSTVVTKFSNKNDLIILTQETVTFKNKKKLKVKIEYLSSQWLNKLKLKERLNLENKKKNQRKEKDEMNSL